MSLKMATDMKIVTHMKMSEEERFSAFKPYAEYRKGYRKALYDVTEWLANHHNDMRFKGCYSSKRFPHVMRAISMQWEQLMKYGNEADILLPDEAFPKSKLEAMKKKHPSKIEKQVKELEDFWK